ncbi:alpha/beta fold hydrolase [Ruania zhangjianzhongii]|uniref:alpha/beta fold hydrolase n=1 Tax=Ruania zhangjianzhongii TaxID=2603206 RepID=UPI0011CC0886|nr:alpha/beta hydrolase [Ruania zhangjianzhongii]
MTALYTDFDEIHPATQSPSAQANAPHRPVLMLHGGNVAGWMWGAHLARLSDRTVLTPDTPGFGKNAELGWPGIKAVTDRFADQVRALDQGPADVVGLSMGGIITLYLAARHPDVVASAFVTGASVLPYPGWMRASNAVQIAVWESPRYWRGVARGVGLTGDDAAHYVEQGQVITRSTMRAVTSWVNPGIPPEVLRTITVPLLGVAGSREPAYFRRSLHALRAAVPHAETRLVPGVHHIWTVEAPELFDDVLGAWIDGGVHPELEPLPRR